MDNKDEVLSLLHESRALEQVGQIAQAIRLSHQAFDQSRSSGMSSLAALALTRLSRQYFRLGKFSISRAYAHEAMLKAEPSSETYAEALLVFGSTFSNRSPRTAEGYFRQVAGLCYEMGYRDLQFSALHNLASAHFLRGQFDLALASDEQAIHLAREYDLSHLLWYPYVTTGWIQCITGQFEALRGTLSLLHACAAENTPAWGYARCLQANLAVEEGDLSQSARLFSDARRCAEATGDASLTIHALLGLCRQHVAAGELASARHYAVNASERAKDIEYLHLQGQAFTELGNLAILEKNLQQAEQSLLKACQIFDEIEAGYDLAVVDLLLSHVYRITNQPQAQTVSQRAVERIWNGGYIFLLDQKQNFVLPILSGFIHSRDPQIKATSLALINRIVHIPPRPLKITTFKELKIQKGQTIITTGELRARRAGELLVFLLLSPTHTRSVDEIMDTLWPNPEKRYDSFNPVYHTTTTLRKLLEPGLPDKFTSRYLDVSGGMVRFMLPPGSTIDFIEAEKFVHAARWEDALEICQEEWLPEYRYAPWSSHHREEMLLMLLHVRLALAENWLAGQQPYRALITCRRILAVEPWNEKAALLGMKACLALGDGALAARMYRALLRSLKEEFGTQPQAELTALFRSISTRP